MQKIFKNISLFILFGLLISSCKNTANKTANSLFIKVDSYVVEFTVESENIIRFQYYQQGAKLMQDPHLINQPTKNIDKTII